MSGQTIRHRRELFRRRELGEMRLLFRCRVRTHKRRHDGIPSWSFGLRIGYWPCLRAPFVQIAAFRWVLEVWHGYPDKEQYARAGDA